MSSFPLNIFFYWDGEIPEAIIKNVENYKKNNVEYNVIILNNNDINKYYDLFPTLINLFYLSTISALKADIIRMIFLYMEGGIWIDSNTILKNNNGIKILFDMYKNFDFVITMIPKNNFDLASGVLLSKKKSILAYNIIEKIQYNLLKHYNLESQTTEYIAYNLYLWVGGFLCSEILEYKYNEEFKNSVKKIYSNNENNILTLDLPKFKEYNCGILIIDKYLSFYGCNMDHHHGKNIHKHWSILQKSQKLFKM